MSARMYNGIAVLAVVVMLALAVLAGCSKPAESEWDGRVRSIEGSVGDAAELADAAVSGIVATPAPDCDALRDQVREWRHELAFIDTVSESYKPALRLRDEYTRLYVECSKRLLEKWHGDSVAEPSDGVASNIAGHVIDWRAIETAPTDGIPVLISAGRELPGAHKYRTTYIAYWAEHMSADGGKEWRDASTHQALPHTAYAWMPVPKEQVDNVQGAGTNEVTADIADVEGIVGWDCDGEGCEEARRALEPMLDSTTRERP